jgi:3-phenylpropionate/cinnamic acid dioxygenase small subunit
VSAELSARGLGLGLKEKLEEALFNYARTVDEQRFHDWLDLFTEDATYSVMTYENQQDQGLYLVKDEGKEALKERAAYVLGFWQAPRGKMLHAISNVDVAEISATQAHVRSYLVVYRTARDGDTQLHCCGTAEDVLVREGDRWLFKQRAIVVDNGMPPNFTELL